MKSIKKEKKIAISITSSVIALLFILKGIAIEWQVSTLLQVFDLGSSTSGSMMFMYSVIFGTIALPWLYEEVKFFRIVVICVCFIYVLLQFISLLMTILFVGAGYDDGYVIIDICRYLVQGILAVIPAAVLADSLGW